MTPERHIPIVRPGFSLVELVIVVAIIGTVAAIALPRFAQANARQQLAAATNRVAADLEKAQHHARATSNWVEVNFDTAANRYTFSPQHGDAFVVELHASPYEIELSKATFNGSSTVQFNGFGIPNSGGKVTLQSAAGAAIITLNASGEVSR